MNLRQTADKTTSFVDREASRWGAGFLRWTAASLWLGNVSWKRPPDFGRTGSNCRALCKYVEAGIEHPVLPGSAWLFEHVISPNLGVFGWVTILGEGTVAVLLLAGRYRRMAGFAGVLLSAGILAAVANAPGEWYWAYLLMIALHIGVIVTTPGAPEPPARTIAGVTVGFGAAMAFVHLGDGATGTAFTFFDRGGPLPGDLVRNLFGGSVVLGLLLTAVGIAGLVVATRRTPDQARFVGAATMALAAIMFVTYGPDGTLVGLGSTTTSACVLAGLGLGQIVRPRPASDPDAVSIS